MKYDNLSSSCSNCKYKFNNTNEEPCKSCELGLKWEYNGEN